MPICPQCRKRYVHERCFNCNPVADPAPIWETRSLPNPCNPDWDMELRDLGVPDYVAPGFATESEEWIHEPTTDRTHMWARLRPDQICEEYGFSEHDDGPDGTCLIKEVEGGMLTLTGIKQYSQRPPAPDGFCLQFAPYPGGPPLWWYWYDYMVGEGEIHWRVLQIDVTLQNVTNLTLIHNDEDEDDEFDEQRYLESRGMGDATPMELACVAMYEMDIGDLRRLKTLVSQVLFEKDQDRLRAQLPARMEQAREKATDAFWSVVAEAFPEAESGDFDPPSMVVFEQAALRAIETWIDLNLPTED